MLNTAKTLKGYTLGSLDGDIGKVKEFYFDDLHWTIRYLVADTGNWLIDRQVLISPHALAAVDKEAQNIAINLTKKQIEDSPPLDSDKPVSRHFGRTTTGTMDGRCIGAAHTCGDILPTLYVTVKNGVHPPGERKRGITICAALMRCVAITFKPQTARWPRRRFYHRRRDVGDSLSHHRYTELVAGEKGPDFTAMDRAR